MYQKKLRILHVEDEADAVVAMSKLVDLFVENATISDTANTIKEAIDKIDKGDFDVIFLDLNLPDGDGFDIVKSRKDLSNRIILTTADESYGIQALKAGVLDYILKPYSAEDIQDAVNKVISNETKEDTQEPLNLLHDKVRVPDINGVQLVSVSDILRFESDRNYTKIFLQDGSSLYASKTLKFFEDSLDNRGFIRIHQSHLVNSKFIARVNKAGRGNVELVNGESINCSLAGKNLLKKSLGI